MSRRQRILHRLTWLLVATIGAIAFTASFEAIADYAGQVGWGSRMKYAAPLLVDTFTVAAGLVILARAEDGVRAVYAWCLLIAAAGVSVGLNIAHAPEHLSARFVAALPPAALLAAVELAMSEARRSRSSKPALANPPAGVGERVPGPHTQAPAPTTRAAAPRSRPVGTAVTAGREHPTSPRVQSPPAPGESTPADLATIAAHAYDDRGERMGEKRVGPALRGAGHSISNVALRRALADLPDRRNGHGAGVAAQ